MSCIADYIIGQGFFKAGEYCKCNDKRCSAECNSPDRDSNNKRYEVTLRFFFKIARLFAPVLEKSLRYVVWVFDIMKTLIMDEDQNLRSSCHFS